LIILVIAILGPLCCGPGCFQFALSDVVSARRSMPPFKLRPCPRAPDALGRERFRRHHLRRTGLLWSDWSRRWWRFASRFPWGHRPLFRGRIDRRADRFSVPSRPFRFLRSRLAWSRTRLQPSIYSSATLDRQRQLARRGLGGCRGEVWSRLANTANSSRPPRQRQTHRWIIWREILHALSPVIVRASHDCL